MRKLAVLLGLTLAMTLGPAFPALALVDMRSAAYSYSFIDVVIDEPGFHFSLQRSYRSRTLYVGMFGFGWCSMLETRLSYATEDVIRLSECGDGQEEDFVRLGANAAPESAERRSKRLAPALRRDNLPAEDVEKYLGALKDIVAGLQGYEKQLGRTSLGLPVGVYRSGLGRTITVTAAGVTLESPGQARRRFDRWGRLVEATIGADAVVAITRMGARRMRLTGGGHTIDLMLDEAGKYVQRIEVDGVQQASYVYSAPRDPEASRDLVSMQNQWARSERDTYAFAYNEYRNLTRITWPDRLSVELTYNNQNDWVTAFRDRDGCTETYTYAFGTDTPPGFEREAAELAAFVSPFAKAKSVVRVDDQRLHFASGVEKTCSDGVVARNLFEFGIGMFDSAAGKRDQDLWVATRTGSQLQLVGYSSEDVTEVLTYSSPLNVVWRQTLLGEVSGSAYSYVGPWGVFRRTSEPGCSVPKQMDGFLTLDGKSIPVSVAFALNNDRLGTCRITSSKVTIAGAAVDFSGSPSAGIEDGALKGSLNFMASDFVVSCHRTSGGELPEDVKTELAGGDAHCTAAERAALLLAAMRSWGWI